MFKKNIFKNYKGCVVGGVAEIFWPKNKLTLLKIIRNFAKSF